MHQAEDNLFVSPCKEFIYLNLKFIIRLICLKVKWECENLRMNKKCIFMRFWNGEDLGSSLLGLYPFRSFHALVDSGCACLDPNPVKCKPIPSFSFFFLQVHCVGDTRPRLIKFAINKLSLGLNILDEKEIKIVYMGANQELSIRCCCLLKGSYNNGRMPSARINYLFLKKRILYLNNIISISTSISIRIK